VLSPELELADLDARHWNNWWRLLAPPRALDRPTWALAILDEGRVIKLVIAGDRARGSIDPETVQLPVRGWTEKLGVGAVIAIERGVLGELSAEIEGALRMDMDLVAQGLVALKALKKRAGHGVWTEPALLDVLPAPTIDPIQRTFDLLIPNRTALVAYVIEDDHSRIHSSIIAVKDKGDIVRAATHRAIDDLLPEVTYARDWHKSHARLVSVVEERFAKPSVVMVAQRKTILDVMTGPSDQLAREINAKRMIIDPAPAWLLTLLGGAAVAAMAGRAATALASMLPQAARDRASAIASKARDVAMHSGPFAALGFDPIELWAQLKQFYRRS
jgi:hypothetical protein